MYIVTSSNFVNVKTNEVTKTLLCMYIIVL